MRNKIKIKQNPRLTTHYRPFTNKERVFIRKAFMIDGVQEKFNEWIDNNLIYCEDTESFVHKCYDQFKFCNDYREAQNMAFEILDLMRLEFLYCTYDHEDIKKRVKEIQYITPLERLQQSIKKMEEAKK
ncbi:hypothetical protein HYU06_01535 [Candidatus Woesearchaeota archaeon]|nr:hypothetical protein [Candidatus Woesearchaeota archaeon]